MATVIGKAGANVVEVYHQRVFTDLPAKGSLELHLVIETRDRDHLEETVGSLKSAGFAVLLKGAAPAR